MEQKRERDYGAYWERFWQSVLQEPDGKPLWEIPEALGIGKDYSIFHKYFSKDLPLLDLGCGTGKQSAFLAKKYQKIVAVDVSTKAIETAKLKAVDPNISFDRFDITDNRKAIELHEQHGDMNVYIRGVLHQIPKEDLPVAVASIKTILGQKGMLYIIESDELMDFLGERYSFSNLPPSFKKVITSNFPQKGISEEELEMLFSDFNIHEKGKASLPTNIDYKEGKLDLPAVYAILENQK